MDLKGSLFAPLKWKALVATLSQNQTKLKPQPPKFPQL